MSTLAGAPPRRTSADGRQSAVLR